MRREVCLVEESLELFSRRIPEQLSREQERSSLAGRRSQKIGFDIAGEKPAHQEDYGDT
jgi:hypothetical protein